MKNYFIKLMFTAFLFCFHLGRSQHKHEREHRILKSQFPALAIEIIDENVIDFKRIKFYKEIDSTKISYEAKLKKDKLWYSIEFDQNGLLEDIEILIKPTDVPNNTYTKIVDYLNKNYLKYKIRRLQQQYYSSNLPIDEIFKNAFQNLMLPYINYELIVSGKKDKGYLEYEILFDADGNFKKIRTSLPPNYDHILY
ncbi:PepSY-like domain-containing protein [Maribacter ulvicola]|uniref:Putative beta-lactamase-inhibitor-like, PepSY-like n=1 Tax=Maribacter ulvicola TaxID=228959 RepID=A0A1N6NSY5_9FLAO|nr:PepSY-like domain-containing protein [Maribacter ulvicola]SIP95204.1 Putative beta-lactamase-inhibitor-like, PepSY-like [Maribacter ulvicola]